ncbi:hypothetical protein [Streptomyces sp. enrichment culture]|uniref:hypothetical protein n=1 Tax=Streptomyces sp. enrichment culture TaxID=1795815 RepID=UPI003F55E040
MDTMTATEIFEAANQATDWKRLTTGLVATVNHGGYTYTITLPGSAPAEITWRTGFGGTEYVGAQGDWRLTLRLTDAAMGALRVL